jgi:CheY-like chemotaxis protein
MPLEMNKFLSARNELGNAAYDSGQPVDLGGAFTLRSGVVKSSPREVAKVAPVTRRFILVADDDASLRDTVAQVLIDAGFETDTARDGEEAWQAITKTKYDLLITDHEMPRLKGLELVERLRTFPDAPSCILISGSLPRAEWILKETVYPAAFLAKPFTVPELIETIFSLLGSGISGVFEGRRSVLTQSKPLN